MGGRGLGTPPRMAGELTETGGEIRGSAWGSGSIQFGAMDEQLSQTRKTVAVEFSIGIGDGTLNATAVVPKGTTSLTQILAGPAILLTIPWLQGSPLN